MSAENGVGRRSRGEEEDPDGSPCHVHSQQSLYCPILRISAGPGIHDSLSLSLSLSPSLSLSLSDVVYAPLHLIYGPVITAGGVPSSVKILSQWWFK